MIEKGRWVQISKVVLEPEERASQVPEDTKETPLVMWVKGHLLEDGEMGEEVRIQTVTGREETGTLVQVDPIYTHNFGKFVPEIIEIHHRLSQEMEEI